MKHAFTLIEVSIVIAVMAILLSIGTLTLTSLKYRTYVDTTVETLISDIKHQQLLAMTGDTAGAGTLQPYGVYFGSDRYTLFRGATYDANDPLNFTITLSDAIVFSSLSFPQSQLVFSKGSGEVASISSGTQSVTIRNTVSNDQKTVELNQFGIITRIY